MPDILANHRVLHERNKPDFQKGPHLFDLNNQGPAISIPDQMFRGYYAILEGLNQGYIGPDRPLLVIGAGVAGLMAAMTAVTVDNVPTWIVEKEGPLRTLAYCPTRFVCPTQYEWPADHWQKGFYPFDGEPMPYSWIRGLVAYVVKNPVLTTVNSFLAEHPQLFRMIISEFEGLGDLGEHDGNWWVSPRLNPEPLDPDFPRAFPMILACAGFGCENTTAWRLKKCPSETDHPDETSTGVDQAPYTGYKFWQEDRYESTATPLGLVHGCKPKVLVSGSGDGALQDFLRIATRAEATGYDNISAGALYANVTKLLNSRTRRQMEERLLTVEDEFRNGISRTVKTRDKCAIYTRADSDHQSVIQGLREDTRCWGQITQALDEVVKDLSAELAIKVVYPCSHLMPFYGLNRFLVLLIAAYADTKYPDVKIFHPNTIVSNVIAECDAAGQSHLCSAAVHCHGQEHEIFFSAGHCPDLQRECINEEHKLDGGPYNVVIIRHGIVRGSRADLLGGH